ncbi:hypothetical protein M404DRAFT_1002169 [Pisolithus tinctorius Marx 270]|uniref:Uncharacterized protein n=1 Tax=Pisolithus tinctorius Marx 270 TaxID=870435 RepID=A0A0C3P500_PISTI|nr:hypothetical protein M404DRAFT_1002169 [Pisolithus tinctorius Marx 270]
MGGKKRRSICWRFNTDLEFPDLVTEGAAENLPSVDPLDYPPLSVLPAKAEPHSSSQSLQKTMQQGTKAFSSMATHLTFVAGTLNHEQQVAR